MSGKVIYRPPEVKPYILTDIKNTTLALLILTLRVQDCFEKIFVELKSTIGLLNFNTQNEMQITECP